MFHLVARKLSHFLRLVFLVYVFVALGCRPQKGEETKASPEILPEPQRIISFAPNITETVFALGCGARLVGVTDFCDYPPEVATIKRVGGHINPDLETVAMLKPDLIFVQGLHEKVATFAEQNHIPLVRVNMDTLDTIDEGIRIIGETLHRKEEADQLRSRIQSELAALRKETEQLPKLRVLVITTRLTHDMNNLYTLGGASFISEILEIAGGENIFHDAHQAYLEASKESVVARAPEVIIEFHAGEKLSEEDQQRFREDWQTFASLPAVQQNRIYLVMESHALRPGPRVAEIARILARCLHPERFSAAEHS